MRRKDGEIDGEREKTSGEAWRGKKEAQSDV